MATFTIEFGDALEIGGGRVVFAGEEMSENTHVVGGIFQDVFAKYPIFDEDYRERLNGLIIDRYYNQEIGHETVQKFRLQFRAKLNEIMPHYNRLYEANLSIVDPIQNVNITNTNTQQGTQTQSTESENDTETATHSGSRSVFSDLPQTMLAGNEDYAANATDANSGSSVTANATENTNAEIENEQSGESTTKGYQGSPTALFAEFRDSFMNIDVQLLDELQELFMQVWQSGDTFTQKERPHYYAF